MFNRTAFRISLIYLVVSVIWILGTDYFMAQMVGNFGDMLNMGIIKGLLFVTLSSLLIYLLIALALNNLKTSKERLDAALKGGDLGLWEHNVVTGENYMNDKWWQMLGYQPDEVEYSYDFFKSLLHPDDYNKPEEQRQKILETGVNKMEMIIRLKTKQGSYKYILDRGNVVEYSSDGAIVRLVGTHMDITETIQAKELLKETNQIAKVGGWEYDLKSKKFIFTDEAYSIYGLKPGAKVLLKDRLERIPPAKRAQFENAFKELVEEGKEYDLELPFVDANGVNKWVRTIGRCEQNDRKTLRVYGAIQDISERKGLEKLLHLAERVGNMGGWQYDVDSKTLTVTDEVKKICGLQPHDELSLEQGFDFFPAKEREIVVNAFNDLMAHAIPFDVEVPMIDANGNMKFVRGIGTSGDENGSSSKVYGTLQDVSKHVHDKELIQLAQSINKVGGWEYNPQTQETVVTEEVKKIYGLKPNLELSLEEGISCYQGEDQDKLIKAFNALVENGEPYDLELRFMDMNNTHKWVRAIGRCDLMNEVVMRTYGTLQDITEQKIAELELIGTVREMQDLQYTLDQSSIVAITDVKGDILYANDKFVAISGYSREELLGQNHRIINAGYHPKKFFTDLWKTIAKGEVWRGEIKNKKKNGDYYWVDTTIIPQKDENGKPFRYYAVRNEITQRKNAEEKLSELNKELEQRVSDRTARLIASNKELEAFNYMLSHDLRTPLRAIKMFIKLLTKKVRVDDDEINELVKYIDSGIAEMSRLIDDLLEYARLRLKELVYTEVNIEELICANYEVVKTIYPMKEAKLEVNNLPEKVWVDRHLFEHLILNLLGNSFKYAKEEQNLKIEIDTTEEDDHIIFQFKDNGIGFDPKFSERMFQPFKRLVNQSHSQGSGIGLSICMRIVEMHNGKIWAEGEKGKGATIYIRVPKKPLSTLVESVHSIDD